MYYFITVLHHIIFYKERKFGIIIYRMEENNSIASVQSSLKKKENSNTNFSLNCNELMKNTLYNEYFLEYNLFTKSRKKINFTQPNTQGKEENIIKIMTESWI